MPTAEPPAARHPQRHLQRHLQRPSVPRSALVVVLVLVFWPLRARPLTLGPDAGHPWRAWVIVFAAIVAWELAEYAARGSRAEHPTFSSMLDAVNRFYGLKALVFFLWLYLGAAIVRRGGRRQRRARRAAS